MTKYYVNGTDLSNIFYLLSSGGGTALTTNTGFVYNTGTDYKDLITLFAKYERGDKAVTTGYKSSAYGIDLNEIFQNTTVPPSIYSIDSLSNITITKYNNNGYTGLVFEVETDTNSNCSATITFYQTIPDLYYIIVGGGGGGGGIGGGGGGGGGTTYSSSAFDAGSYDISVGFGGLGSRNNGSTGNNTSFDILISYGGGAGRSGNSGSIGGAGGSINSTYGGGGGGGGGGGEVNTSTGGSPGTAYGGINSAGSSQGFTSKSTGGYGGNSYYYENNKSVLVPFISSTATIQVGGGGGGGGSSNPNATFQSGYCGNGIGGTYGYGNIGSDGQSSNSSISSGYGNGGGGGDYGGGNGGSGVVILYWSNS